MGMPGAVGHVASFLPQIDQNRFDVNQMNAWFQQMQMMNMMMNNQMMSNGGNNMSSVNGSLHNDSSQNQTISAHSAMNPMVFHPMA